MSSTISSYLDSHISSFDTLLSSLDTVTASLRSASNQYNEELLSIQTTRSQSQQGAVNAFRALFTAWVQNSSNIVDPSRLDALESEFKKTVEELHTQFPQIETDLPRLTTLLNHEFTKIKNLIYSTTVLQSAKDVRDTAIQLKSIKLNNQQQYDMAFLLLQKVENEQAEKLRSLAKSNSKKTSSSTTSKIAVKTLKYINSDMRYPLQQHLEKQLTSFFTKAKWPTSTIPTSLYAEFTELFVPYLNTEPKSPEILQSLIIPESQKEDLSYPLPLAAFSALVKPIDLRFRYHFDTPNSSTNRIDKPEWIYHHFLNIIDGHIDFLLDCLSETLKQSNNFQDRNGVHEFITALLPSIRRKALTLFDHIQTSPPLLSHLIYETVLFDNALKEKYIYQSFNSASEGKEWRGITGDILSLNNSGNFQIWLDVESASAFERYNEIIDSSDAWKIDYEFVSSDETKPTDSAINVRDLVESLTAHYASLASLKFRLRYFVAVQLGLLDRYYERLKESLSAFVSMTSRFSRAVGSVSADDAELVKGINGIERLSRIIGSLSYVIRALEQWGEEEFYLQLWEDITSRTKGNSGKTNDNVGGINAMEKFAAGDSSVVFDNTTLFDETIESYTALRTQAENALINLLRTEFNGAMREYFKKNDWITVVTDADDPPSSPESLETSGQRQAVDSPSISRELVSALRSTSVLLTFLYRFYSPLAYNKIIRQYMSTVVEKYLWSNIINANTFSLLGAKQLQNDINAIVGALRMGQKASDVASVKKLEQATSLLASEAKGTELTISSLYVLVKRGDFDKIRESIEVFKLTDLEIEGLVNRRVDKRGKV